MINYLENKITYLHEKYPVYCGRAYIITLSLLYSSIQLISRLCKSIGGPIMTYYFALAPLCIVCTYSLVTKKDKMVFYRKDDQDIQSKQIIRGTLGSIGYIITMIGSQLIPLHIYGILLSTNVIISIPMGKIFRGNPITLTMVILTLFSLFGISLVICPSLFGLEFLIPKSQNKSPFDVNSNEFWKTLQGVFCGIYGAFNGVLLPMLVGDLARVITAWQNIFYWATFTVAISGFFSIFQSSEIDSNYQIFLLFFGSMLSIPFLFCQFYGAKFEKSLSNFALQQNLYVQWNFQLEWLVFDGDINIQNITGGLIVFSSGIYILIEKEKTISDPKISYSEDK